MALDIMQAKESTLFRYVWDKEPILSLMRN